MVIEMETVCFCDGRSGMFKRVTTGGKACSLGSPFLCLSLHITHCMLRNPGIGDSTPSQAKPGFLGDSQHFLMGRGTGVLRESSRVHETLPKSLILFSLFKTEGETGAEMSGELWALGTVEFQCS